jgi:hypothetical protein
VSPLLALFLLTRPATAATPLLVSAFEAQDPASRLTARALEQVLARRLARNPAYETHRVEEVPRFPDYDARVYVKSCPAGEHVGCAQVLGERLGVPWAVTGRVETSGTVSTVTFVVVDVSAAREVVAFPSEPFSEVDAELVDGLIQILDSAVAGDYAEIDIRRTPESRELRENERAYARKELDAIESEVRSVKDARGVQLAEQRALTAEDLVSQDRGEGQAPWERLGMKASTYLRYKNSGLSLSDWRTREAGRRGQVLVQPALGFGRGPFATGYHGRYAYDTDTDPAGAASLVVVDAQSVQFVRTRQGAVFGLSASYGVLPWLDVGWQFAVTPSGVELDIDGMTVGQPDTASPARSEPGMAWSTGPRVTAAFLPTSAVRPRVSSGLALVAPTAAADVVAVPPELAAFDAPRLWGVEVEPGAEVRIGPRADLVVGLPIAVMLGGAFQTAAQSGERREFPPYVPEVAEGLSAGVRLAVQFHLGQARPARGAEAYPPDGP